MVFLDDRLLSAAEDSSDDERSALSPEEAPDPPSSCSIPSQTHSQLVTEVRGHGHPGRVDLSVSHSIASLSREVELGRRTPSPGAIPVRSVTSLRPLFDFAGSSSTYGHGRELGGRSSVLALQVPASSLPPPLTASAMVDSFQISASTAFFSPLPSGEQGLLDSGPSTRESMPCMPCQASQNSDSAPVSSDRIGDPVNSGVQPPLSCPSGQGEIVRRLTEVLQGRGDEDFVLQSTGRDNMMSQWLQALDVHVVGACRADERLRPMLRWNVACCDADGCLLAHLSQHFKAKELGMLARCLCAPLVSIRVGKIQRQGRFLCPTSSRGYLSLTMLPCSEMRLSFIGDNGVIERIATVKSVNEDTHVALEILDPDSSGRSFALKLSGGNHFFWQSQRSKIVGDELVAEMKDLLTRRPTLSQLTGVHESRLDSFVSQLQNALAATSTHVGFQHSYTMPSSLIPPSNAADTSSNVLSPSGPRQSQRLSGNRSTVRPMNGNQGSLSPRASGFKEGAFRGLMNVRSVMSLREKHRRCLENSNSVGALTFSNAYRSSNMHINPDLGCVSQPPMTACVAVCISREERVEPRMDCAGLNTSSSYVPNLRGLLHNDVDSFPKQVFSVPVVTSSFPASPNLLPCLLGGSSFSSSGLHPPMPSHFPIPTSTLLAPYYCPCPLRSSALQYTITPPFLPPASEMSTVPSSSSFFSVKPSSAILSQTTISLDRVSISPIPLPVSSLVNIPTPLQTSTLPSFFSDPIVHIPVIDLQSANQSFLVSTPPAISSSGIPPMLPSFLSNILPGAERLVDGQELPALSIFQGLGVAPCQSEDEHRDSNDVQPFLIDSRFRALLASCSEDRPAKDGVEQVTDASWCARLESLRSSAHDTIPQYSGPLLGMVPAILTSGSLSCVLNFCQERSTKATAWVSGSRGLYGGSCEPGIPAPSIASCSSSLGASVRVTDIFQLSKNKGLLADSVDLSLNGSPKDREEKLTDEESRKEG